MRRRAARRRVAWTASPSSIVQRQRRGRHRHHHPGPADRHEHHRPGGRGSALHHQWGEALMVYATAATDDRRDHRRRPHRRVARLPALEPAPRPARGRRRARAGAQPQALHSDEELEGPKLERTLVFGLAMLVVIAVGLPLYWLAEPGRQAGAVEGFNEQLRRVGLAATSTPPPNGGFNCAGCHGGMDATGGAARLHASTTRTPARSRRSTGRRRRSTRCCTGSPTDEVKYILNYGRPFSPMPPWGLARRRPDERPADRERHRLHRSHPGADGRLQGGRDHLRHRATCPPAIPRRPPRRRTRPTRSSGPPRRP